jgi:hypothetical protein
LGAFHGLVDRPGGLFDVAHHSPPDPATPLHAQPEDLGAWIASIARDFGDHGHDLGRAEIQSGDEPLGLVAHAPTRTMTWPA